MWRASTDQYLPFLLVTKKNWLRTGIYSLSSFFSFVQGCHRIPTFSSTSSTTPACTVANFRQVAHKAHFGLGTSNCVYFGCPTKAAPLCLPAMDSCCSLVSLALGVLLAVASSESKLRKRANCGGTCCPGSIVTT